MTVYVGLMQTTQATSYDLTERIAYLADGLRRMASYFQV